MHDKTEQAILKWMRDNFDCDWENGIDDICHVYRAIKTRRYALENMGFRQKETRINASGNKVEIWERKPRKDTSNVMS